MLINVKIFFDIPIKIPIKKLQVLQKGNHNS